MLGRRPQKTLFSRTPRPLWPSTHQHPTPASRWPPQSTEPVPPPLRGGPPSAAARLLSRPSAPPGHLKQAPPTAPALQNPKGHEVHGACNVPQGPRLDPAADQASRAFLAPGTACSPGATHHGLPTLQSARVGSGLLSGPPERFWATAPAPIAATAMSKMTAGLTRGPARVRPSQHRLQEK
ncbi:hypothetical protein NDU88_006426 [Pleurodeles waltl]|uniref:Uncharacterized protein n=1 Tax=Pleurodeles waltl TaxID=8319 RepID=A0AAV7WXJ8_PLEWA|nr:hypothetical protein NDU88_006426 [Pleurodeles waltl]